MSATNFRRNDIELPQHLDEICGSARTKPVVGVVVILEGIEKAEGIVDIGRRPREVIAVILLLQSLDGFLASYLLSLGKVVDIVGHLRQHLVLGDAAHSSIVGAHGDVLQVVKLAEDAELRELGDAGEEDELEIWVTVFQRRIEIAHHIAQHRQRLLLMNHVEQRGIILVDEYDNLLACLLVCTENQVLQSYIRVFGVRAYTQMPLVFLQNIEKIAFQLILLHMLARSHA